MGALRAQGKKALPTFKAPPALAESMRIRDATPDDVEALHALAHAAYAQRGERPLPDTPDDWRAFLRDSRVLVAEDDEGRIVGTVGVRRIADVRRLAVAPEAKGKGVGSALLEAALDAARDEGFVLAELGTIPGHAWLPDFYRRHGFADRCTQVMPDGTEWLILRRRLD